MPSVQVLMQRCLLTNLSGDLKTEIDEACVPFNLSDITEKTIVVF